MRTRNGCPRCGEAGVWRLARWVRQSKGAFWEVCRGCGGKLVLSPWSVACGTAIWAALFFSLYWMLQTGIDSVPTKPDEPGSWSAIASTLGLHGMWTSAVFMIVAMWIGMGLTLLVSLAATWWLGQWWASWRIKDEDAQHCWSCGYDVRANPAGPCGECGAELGYDVAVGCGDGHEAPR